MTEASVIAPPRAFVRPSRDDDVPAMLANPLQMTWPYRRNVVDDEDDHPVHVTSSSDGHASAPGTGARRTPRPDFFKRGQTFV